MTVPFNQVPNNIRVPFLYAEFDNSKAIQGSLAQPHQVLIMGQKLAIGTSDELVLETVNSEAEARSKYGVGSQMHAMVKSFREIDTTTKIQCISIDDLAGGVAHADDYTFPAQSVTADGIFYFYVGGRRYQVSVLTAATNLDVVASIIAAVNADDEAYMVAAEGGTADVLRLTAKHKGYLGEKIDVRWNYNDGEELPVGFVVPTIANSATGAGNPDIQEILDVLPDEQYNYILMPWIDAANLNLLKTELESRNDPTKMIEGMAVTATQDSFGVQSSLGNSRNDRFLTIMDVVGPDLDVRWAAAYMARIVQAAQIDAARPFQTLGLNNLLAPEKSELRDFTEKNGLLYEGISVANISDAGEVSISRAITTYKKNPQGATDPSYLDVNTFAILSYVRWDFRNSFLLKYPRHKLADDGNNFASGQPVMTPSVGRVFAVNKFNQWLELGLVENIDQFIEDLVVERNTQDVNRLDFLLSPDLINQMRVAGAQIAFLL